MIQAYQVFSAEVARLRAAAGLSVADAAKAIGITPRVLASIEAGRNCSGKAYLATELWLMGQRRRVTAFQNQDGLTMTIETRVIDGQILSLTDNKGSTWTRQT